MEDLKEYSNFPQFKKGENPCPMKKVFKKCRCKNVSVKRKAQFIHFFN